MPAPSIFQVIRHVLSRALRETGQALDRVGVRGIIHAHQGRRMGPDDPYWFDDHLSRHRGIMRFVNMDTMYVRAYFRCANLSNSQLQFAETGRTHGSRNNCWELYAFERC